MATPLTRPKKQLLISAPPVKSTKALTKKTAKASAAKPAKKPAALASASAKASAAKPAKKRTISAKALKKPLKLSISKPAKRPGALAKTAPKKPAKPSTTRSAKKKLTPASVAAQKAWAGFSPKLKKELRKNLPDTDKDKVPDGFDCRPRNRRKQESFLPEDLEYLGSNPTIEIGNPLSAGTCGEVYSVKGNDNFVIKVPRGFVNNGGMNPNDRQRRVNDSQKELEAELNGYNQYGMENEPLFIPTRAVNIGSSDISTGNFTGLVRPKVLIPKTNDTYDFSDDQIEELRRKVISLSHKGFALYDGLQVGIDRSGRVILFDLGYIEKLTPSSPFKTSEAFATNERMWELFLKYWVKKAENTPESMAQCLEKYGTINPKERY